LSPTKPEHVREEFGDALPLILDGGESLIGLESTIVSCLGNVARLLRPGFITRSELEKVVGPLDLGAGLGATGAGTGANAGGGNDALPRVPGDRVLHYAPLTPLEIVPIDELEARASEVTARGEKVAVLAMRPPLQTQKHMTWINAGKRQATYAHNLYSHLRTLDRTGCAKILVQDVPNDERWDAIRDRLRRAGGMGGGLVEINAG
jgi:L-threonylcarbamoyladenylate synthase